LLNNINNNNNNNNNQICILAHAKVVLSCQLYTYMDTNLKGQVQSKLKFLISGSRSPANDFLWNFA